MTLIDLAKLVKRMREKQKAYFKSKQPAALEESRFAERGVDAALEAVLAGPGLFEQPQEEPK